MAHIVRHECERSERDVLELRGVIAPVTERFCSVETKIKQLQSRIQGFQNLTGQSSLGSGGAAAALSSATPGVFGVSDLRSAEQTLSARISIGVYGPKRSGKSSLISALIGQPELIPRKTRTPLTIMPSSKADSGTGNNSNKMNHVCMRLPDGKAVAVEEAAVKRMIRERSERKDDPGFYAAKARLHVDMVDFAPLSSASPQRRHQQQQQALAAAALKSKQQQQDQQQKAQQPTSAANLLGAATATCDVPYCLVDHPPDDSVTKMRFSSAAISSMAPVEFCDDIVFYVVDARDMGTAKEVDVFDNLVHLHPEEKTQLRAASAFIVGQQQQQDPSSSSAKKKEEASSSSDDQNEDGNNERDPDDLFAPKKEQSSSSVPFVTDSGTRKRLLSCTYFFLSHVDAFHDSEVVLSRNEQLDMGQAQIYDEGWSATHGQQPTPACRSAGFALRRFAMLVEFVMGAPVPSSRVIATSAVGIAHTKAVLSCRNVNRKTSAEALAAMFEAEREAAVAENVAARRNSHVVASATTGYYSSKAEEEEKAEFVHAMYNFSEWFLGPKFMHRADNLPFDELRRIVLNFATYRSSVTSGAKALDSLFSVVLHNLAAHFFLSVCNAAAEVAESLGAASALGNKVIESEVANARESEGVLVREYDWTTSQIDAIQHEARLIPERAVQSLEEQLTRFRDSWLEELCDIFARKPLEWFKSRQIATVRDVQAALVRYDAFSDQFASHHRYLHTVMAGGGGGGGGAAASASSPSVTPATSFRGNELRGSASALSGSSASMASRVSSQQQQQQQTTGSGSKFIRDNIRSLYEAAIKSREDKLFDANTCVAHHLRDEVLQFVRSLSRSSNEDQGRWLLEFGRFCRVPVGQARSRFFSNRELQQKMGAATDFADVLANTTTSASKQRLQQLTSDLASTAVASEQEGPLWLAHTAAVEEVLGGGGGGAQNSHDIVAEDTRQLNIYCREIVEPVTSAQSELVLLDEDEQQAESETQEELSRGNGCDDRVGGGSRAHKMSALEQLHENKRESAAKKSLQERNTREVTVSLSSGDATKIRHRFMFDAWRLALFSLRLEQVSHFDMEPFIAKIASLTAAAVDAMAEFRETLSIGIEEHAEIVMELERDMEALDTLREELPQVTRRIAVDSAARYVAAVNAPSSDAEILGLQKRLGMIM